MLEYFTVAYRLPWVFLIPVQIQNRTGQARRRLSGALGLARHPQPKYQIGRLGVGVHDACKSGPHQAGPSQDWSNPEESDVQLLIKTGRMELSQVESSNHPLLARTKPLSALSLVSNVVQFVDFGYRIGSNSRENCKAAMGGFNH